MGRYDDLLKGGMRGKMLSDLYPLAPNRISDLLQRHPEIPKDFVDFLQEIGAGTLGPDKYSIYDGFEVHGWRMVEIDS